LAPVGEIGQSIDFSRLSVNGNTTFHDATFESAATFQNAALKRPIRARDLTAKGDIEFQSAEIHSFHLVDIDTARIAVNQATIVDEFTIVDSELKRLDCTGAKLQGDVRIEETKIDGQFVSKNVSFGANVNLETVQITSKATFAEAKFDGRVRINAGRYEVIDIERATFDDQFHIRESVWLNQLWSSRTRFQGDVLFHDIRCFETVTFDAAVFHGSVELNDVYVVKRTTGEGAHFEDRVTITDSGFGDGLSLRNTTFDARLEITSLTASGAGVVAVDMAHAELTSGYLSGSTSGRYTYDLTHATVGSVRVDTEMPTFGDARIHQTTFDGFDFSSYRTELEDHEWSLHDDSFEPIIPIIDPPALFYWLGWPLFRSVFAPVIVTLQTLVAGYRISKVRKEGQQEDEEPPEDRLPRQETDPKIMDDESVTGPVTERDVEEIQTTYLKAKNGSNQVGATKIASEFFRREMHFRQVLHAVNVFSGSSPVINLVRWAENGVLRISAGYGERVKRVLASAFFVILGFAGLYGIVGTPEVNSIGDAMAVSMGSFVTLVFSDTPQFASDFLQLAAMIEGFLGALFSALLVFTLTRSIHR